MNERLPGQVRTVGDLCVIAEILIEFKLDFLLPTVLELMLVEIQ